MKTRLLLLFVSSGVVALGCGDDGGGTGGSGGSGTTTTATTSTKATTATGTTASTTATTTATTGTGTTNNTGSTSSGGGMIDCTMLCIELGNIATQIGGNCPHDQMTCETDCAAALGSIPPECEDELDALFQCAINAPIASWSCDQNGPNYDGNECDPESQAFGMCVQ